MSFAQTHASLLNSPKFQKLSMAARGLWVTCQSWCAGQLTDGLIPESAVKDNGGSEAQIRALVKSGLWSEASTEGGEPAYQFHDWLDHNPPAEKISTKKRKERERKAAQRSRRSGEVSPQNLTQSDGDLDQKPLKSDGSFFDETPSDLRESESVPGGKEREGKETQDNGRGRGSPGTSLTPETESKEEDNLHHSVPSSLPSPSDSASGPPPSDARLKKPVVDTSGTYNLSPATLKRRFESLMGRDFEDDLPLEDLDPAGLLKYIIKRQTDNLGEPPISRGMKSDLEAITHFQTTHGAFRAARMLRYVFETERGRMQVSHGGEVEDISAYHFREAMGWWHAKIDQASREEAEREADREAGVSRAGEFVFSSSLW